MTPEQRQKILDILAYNVGSIWFALGGWSTTKEFCYQKAEKVFNSDIQRNGENFLLHLLENEKGIIEDSLIILESEDIKDPKEVKRIMKEFYEKIKK